MAKMIFTNDNTKAVFENGQLNFEQFVDLATNAGLGRKIYNTEGKEVDSKNVNSQIRKKFYEVLGLEEGTKGKELRRAFRRKMIDVFEVTEDILANLVITGWGANPFFNEFVEMKNAELGETNEFYTPDEVILSVSEVSNDHTNIDYSLNK